MKSPPWGWSTERNAVASANSQNIIVRKDDRALTFAEVIAGWRESALFRAFYCNQLAATPWPAFFWEMPPVRRGHTEIPYQCMIIRSDALARMPPDEHAFAAQFKNAPNFVAAFPNLGGDAILVAPEQIAASSSYSHLGAFVRSAPSAQQHLLFQALALAIDEFLHVYEGRVWISTSGLGVAWLHIRLDKVPKYYQHQPYARM